MSDNNNGIPISLNDGIFHEYKYAYSHSIQSEVLCGICRLEIPIDMKIDNNYIAEDIYITAQIISNQLPLHGTHVSTHFSLWDDCRNALIWDYLLIFPIKIRELSLDSILVLTAWTADGKAFGGTSMRFFNENGCLKKGKQKLLFYFGCCGDTNVNILENKTPGNIYDLYSEYDEGFKMEKALEAYKNSISNTDIFSQNQRNDDNNTRDDWLDRFTISQIQSTLSSTLVRGSSSLSSSKMWGCPPEELDLQTFCCLVIELPMLPHDVLHDERLYQTVTPHILPNSFNADIGEGGIFEFNLINRPFNSLNIIADWDKDQPNLCEIQYRCLAHDMLRGSADPGIKPNLQDKERIDKIVQDARYNVANISEEMDLLYKFRYTLTENKKALTKFLLSVRWNIESEVEELSKLLSMWQPIDFADALKLLGREKAFEHTLVREYAVNILRTASDEELLTYLLQLVQALRYDPLFIANKSVLRSPVKSSGDDDDSPSNDYNLSPLANFLIDRGCASLTVANFLYWYLKVETKPGQNDADDEDEACLLYQTIFDTFKSRLSSSCNDNGHMFNQISALDKYLSNILSCQVIAKNVSGRKDVKQEALRKELQNQKLNNVPDGMKSVPMPLDPSIGLIGLDPTSAKMFASAVYPCVITFFSKSLAAPPNAPSEEDYVSVSPQLKTHKIFVKSGDDLRQDQLIMQMISLMDGLLKKVNLDLKLVTYGILALSKNDGIMEFVTDSDCISAILKDHKSISNYLRFHNPDKNGPYEISASVMDTFIKSCAASCVVTYILGIGDRHLDNIMMRSNGQLFHIDFGFIFGQDPKPLPPPFRFTRHMADAMGGEDSEHYAKFKAYCCQAYNWLRKSANLILNLLSLMADAGINDISKRSNINKVLDVMLSKFRLDLTDEQADHFFIGLINESLNALAPRLMEAFHQIAVARR